MSLSLASPGDYTGIQRRSLAFAPNDMTSCVIIDIANDDVVEQDESFEVILEAPPDLDIERVVIAQGVATVKIDDDDGKFTNSTNLEANNTYLTSGFHTEQELRAYR